ncbi:MAG TPA: energy transducer TonB [Chitinophagales bacterium]|nr:energy transducer TonB [Chitinophagales bacterium]HNL05997.1 energy transducer TonB [Chitinophagales bacterium]
MSISKSAHPSKKEHFHAKCSLKIPESFFRVNFLAKGKILGQNQSKYFATYHCPTAQQLKTKEEIDVCGEREIYKFLGENIRYPNYAKENGIMGKVYISFVVRADGSLGSMMSIRKVDNSLMFEAMRVVSMMTSWKPIQLDGKSRPTLFTLPVNFKLQ